MKIELEVEVEERKNDFTPYYPYWLIIDPSRYSKNISCDEIASSISGPYFSEADVDEYLLYHGNMYSKNAKIYCLNGNNSWLYKLAFEKNKKEL